MKEFFKKLGKKLKKFLGWTVYFLVILVWAVYDVFYNSKTHWKIFGMRLPQYIRLGAIIFALFMIFGRKGAIKKGGKNAAGGTDKAGDEDKTGDEETKEESQAETKDETAASCAAASGAETQGKADEPGENGEEKKKDDENRQ